MVNEFSVRDIVARLVADVYAGKIHPKTAASLAQLLNLQLRTFGALDAAQKIFVERRYTWRRPPAKPETSDVEKAESSNAEEPEVSNVGRPEKERPDISSAGNSEISNVVKSRISNGGWLEMASAADPEISKVKKSEITGGSWEVMGNLDEPEVSSEEEPKISSAAKATISHEGKVEVVSAVSADSPIRNPVLPTEEMLARKREREEAIERETRIQLAMASSLSDGFGLDE
jgi:hypothetical protein